MNDNMFTVKASQQKLVMWQTLNLTTGRQKVRLELEAAGKESGHSLLIQFG